MQRFLDTADKGSTGNMWKHTKHCWGEEIVKKADEMKDELTLENIQENLAEAKKGQDGSIVAFFWSQRERESEVYAATAYIWGSMVSFGYNSSHG